MITFRLRCERHTASVGLVVGAGGITRSLGIAGAELGTGGVGGREFVGQTKGHRHGTRLADPRVTGQPGASRVRSRLPAITLSCSARDSSIGYVAPLLGRQVRHVRGES
jgi:hypothetical protein